MLKLFGPKNGLICDSAQTARAVHSCYSLIFVAKVRRFSMAKASLIFPTNTTSVFCYSVVKHLTRWPLNELVKLIML